MGYGSEDAIRMACRNGVPAVRRTPFEVVKLICTNILRRECSDEEVTEYMKAFVNMSDGIQKDSRKLLRNQLDFKSFLISKRDGKQ